MIRLDYSSTDCYYTVALRGERALTPDILMSQYGLDFSLPSVAHPDGISFTGDPYAAASFYEYATPTAADKLGWIMREIEASWAESSGRHIDCPPDKKLEPFQIADVDYIMRRDHALDGDEPGLGKTPTAICVANEMQARRCIVVCPANIRLQWEKRIREWTTMKKPRIYPVFSSRMGMDITAEWTIVSYDLIGRNPALLRAIIKGEWDLGIFDEVHYAKEITTGRARACFGWYDNKRRATDDGKSLEVVTACIAERCKRLLLLSGCLLYTSPSPRDLSTSRMPSSA